MALKGETLISGGDYSDCDICGSKIVMGICQSNAGYYYGSYCSGCGQPNSRETLYYQTADDCQKAKDSGNLMWRDTKYHKEE